MNKKFKDNSWLQILIFILVIFTNITFIAGTNAGQTILAWSQNYIKLLMLVGFLSVIVIPTTLRFIRIKNRYLVISLLLINGYLLSFILALMFLNAPPST
jgi:hypothetical protein